MSDYTITQICPSDKRANRLIDELLTTEGIRRDANLDYTCGMYDDDMNIIATGSCFGNTLRCMAVSHEHQGEGLMNSIVSHLIEVQFSRGNTHLFLYTKCDSARFFGNLGFYEIARINGQIVFMENKRTGFSGYLNTLEKQKEENLQIKLSIIEELKELVESPDDANKSYTEFKKLQQQWNETKLVPQAKVNELWKNYQLYVEKFYDILKLNNEFREYDFKKNLEIKNRLIEAAEKLADEEDVVSAFHQLQKLHQEFRDTGPVAKELRDEVWNRFKTASTVVNRRHQQHFEALKVLKKVKFMLI